MPRPITFLKQSDLQLLAHQLSPEERKQEQFFKRTFTPEFKSLFEQKKRRKKTKLGFKGHAAAGLRLAFTQSSVPSFCSLSLAKVRKKRRLELFSFVGAHCEQ